MSPSPRLVVAGLSGDSGKTLVSLAVALAARERACEVTGFKKGPDYIDPAWLAWATGRPARNLDTFLMGGDEVAASFERHTHSAGLALVEGNRGLYDGVDAAGTHSTAALARLLNAPVLLIVNTRKATRTVAALVLGCQTLDPAVRLAGVVLNQVSGTRHENVIRDAVEAVCRIPVVGALPRFPPGALVVGRQDGLIMPAEHPDLEGLRRALVEQVACHLNVDAILNIAHGDTVAAGPASRLSQQAADGLGEDGRGLRIGYLDDPGFTLYYPENLEALEAAGASLVAVPVAAEGSPPADIHALYIGGGFPEARVVELAGREALFGWIHTGALAGLPIYAEGWGVLLLSSAVIRHGTRHLMTGVLPVDIEVCERPQGHGYVEMAVDASNPFYPIGLSIRGHEFHYSRPIVLTPPGAGTPLPTVCRLTRGQGCWNSRDGIMMGSVWASYTQVHALGTPEWAPGVVRAARRFAIRCGQAGRLSFY